MKHQTSEELGLSAKSTKTPWHLRFAQTAGIGVSQAKSKIEKTAAAAMIVGIALLAEATPMFWGNPIVIRRFATSVSINLEIGRRLEKQR